MKFSWYMWAWETNENVGQALDMKKTLPMQIAGRKEDDETIL